MRPRWDARERRPTPDRRAARALRSGGGSRSYAYARDGPQRRVPEAEATKARQRAGAGREMPARCSICTGVRKLHRACGGKASGPIARNRIPGRAGLAGRGATHSKVTPRTPLAHARGSIRNDFHSLWCARTAMADSVGSHRYAHETRRVDTSVDPAGLGACATVADRRDGGFRGIWRPQDRADSVGSRRRKADLGSGADVDVRPTGTYRPGLRLGTLVPRLRSFALSKHRSLRSCEKIDFGCLLHSVSCCKY